MSVFVFAKAAGAPKAPRFSIPSPNNSRPNIGHRLGPLCPSKRTRARLTSTRPSWAKCGFSLPAIFALLGGGPFCGRPGRVSRRCFQAGHDALHVGPVLRAAASHELDVARVFPRLDARLETWPRLAAPIPLCDMIAVAD